MECGFKQQQQQRRLARRCVWVPAGGPGAQQRQGTDRPDHMVGYSYNNADIHYSSFSHSSLSHSLFRSLSLLSLFLVSLHSLVFLISLVSFYLNLLDA